MMIRLSTVRLMGSRKTLTLGFLSAALLVAILLAVKPAHAETKFTVNSTGDSKDANIDNDHCDINGFLGGDQCTLRAAIEEANDTPGKDVIHFNIPGGGVKTISPNSFLPPITKAVIIDGYTQPGASPNTLTKGNDAVLKIQLDGSGAGLANGLTIHAPNCVVRGLVINRFSISGIITSDDDSKVEGNFLGTNPSGTLDRGNSYGVFINGGSNNTIGGTLPEARNLISGNAGEGIYVEGGNRNKVQGNYIGTTKNRTDALGNSGSGVLIFAASNNIVGGASFAANTIAFNDGAGVPVAGGATSTGNSILNNSIFANALLGIDLHFDGKTPNDAGDADVGENNLQNKPAVIAAVTSSGSTTIEGRLKSMPGETFKVQFFSSPSGIDEGKKFIGQKSVTTDDSGKTSFTFKPKKKVGKGRNITATATSAVGNTSEFSAPRIVKSS